MRPARQQRLRGTSRDDIIASSRIIVEDEGVQQLTIRRIAEAVNRKQPAIYQHFSSKEEILATIVTDGFEALAQRLERTPRGSEPSLSTIAHAYMRFGLERPRLYELMFVGPPAITFAAGAATPEPARRAFDAIAAAVRRIGPRQTDLETVTEVVWSGLHGLVTLTISKRLRPGQALQKARLERLIATIVAVAADPA